MRMQSKVLLTLLKKELKTILRSPSALILQIALPVIVSLICLPARIKYPVVVYTKNFYYKEFSFDEKPTELDVPPLQRLFAVYAPTGELTDRIIKNVERRTGIIFFGLGNENEAINFRRDAMANPSFFAVIFNVTRNGRRETYSYKLRFSSISRSRVKTGNFVARNILSKYKGLAGRASLTYLKMNNWHTNEIYPDVLFTGMRDFRDEHGGSPDYWREGFLWVQSAIDDSILSIKAQAKNKTIPHVAKYMKRMPVPAFIDDKLPQELSFRFVFVAVVSFSFAVLSLAKTLMCDKENGIESILRIMGVKSWVIWLSYLIRIALTYIVTCMLLTVILTAPVKTRNHTTPILYSTNPLLIFMLWYQYLLTTVGFVFMSTRFFKKASTAATFTAIFYVVTIAPWFVISANYERVCVACKYVACLISNIAFTFCMNFIWHWESQGQGLTWKKIYPDDPFTFTSSYLMLVADFFIYVLIGLYFEQVYPGRYGTPKPWYFLFQRSFWMPKDEAGNERKEYVALDPPKIKYYEPKADVPLIQVRGLSKVYKKGLSRAKIKALDEVDVDFYDGEIIALLGQNGAGKSTLINILIGAIQPSGGVIQKNYPSPSETKALMGFCPQYNIVLDKLTVLEHLQFFADVRWQGAFPLGECDYLIDSLDLGKWRHVKAENLSGGKRRALSLAIAMLGHPKIIILDEPTSGMDPVNRQRVWEVLKAVKSDQCVIVSTHYMEEANTISDRIVIISDGRIACSGSRQCLQSNFFDGYEVTVVRKPEFSHELMLQSIRSKSASVKCVGTFGREAKLFIPNSEEHVIKDLLEWLESFEGVEGFGISLLTLDEIFNRITSATDYDEPPPAGVPEPNRKPAANKRLAEEAGAAVARLGIEQEEMKPSSSDALRILRKIRRKVTIAFACFHKNMLYAVRTQPFFTVLQLFPALILCLVLTFIIAVDIITKPVTLQFDQAMFSPANLLVQNIPPNQSQPNESHTFLIYNSILDGLRKAGKYRVVTFEEAVNSGELSGCVASNMDEVLACIGNLDKQRYGRLFPVGFEVKAQNSTGTDQTVSVSMRFNGQPYHPQPVALNVLTNSLMSLIDNQSRVQTSHQPLPLPPFLQEYEEVQTTLMFAQSWGLFYGFGFSITLAGLIVGKIKEKTSGFKHLQHLAGVGHCMYWATAFVGDYFHYLVAAAICLLLTMAFTFKSVNLFALKPLLKPPLVWYLILVQIGYGASVILFVFLLSHLFDKDIKAYTVAAQLNILFGQIPAVIINILSAVNLDRAVFERIQKAFIYLFPGYSMCSAATFIATNRLYRDVCSHDIISLICAMDIVHPCCKKTCGLHCATYTDSIVSLEIPGIGGALLGFAAHFTIYCVLLTALEYKVHLKIIRNLKFFAAQWKRKSLVINDSVSLDDTLVHFDEESYNGKPPAVEVKQVFKHFGDKTAVRGLSLQLKSGECMGIIGPNGAGKTTLLSILTGSLEPSSGAVFIDGRPACNKNRQSLGYCPQSDALVSYLTGSETLHFFARICGYRGKQREALVSLITSAIGLADHADKPVGAFSGGNKRKLSIGLAAIMGKKIIVLDEPTCGVDPTSRQVLWNFLDALKKSDRSLMLTSHSMDECEKLCSRIGVLIDGRIETTGTVQELKLLHGRFYCLFVKTKDCLKQDDRTVVENGMFETPPESLTLPAQTEESFPVGDFILANFPNSRVLTRRPFYATFQLDRSSTSLNKLFTVLTAEKERLRIESFSVCQENLEQLFMRMIAKR